MARFPRKTKSSGVLTQFTIMVEIEGGFEGSYKPIKMTTVPTPVLVSLPREEVKIKAGKMVSITLRGAGLLAEQLRNMGRDIALERSGG